MKALINTNNGSTLKSTLLDAVRNCFTMEREYNLSIKQHPVINILSKQTDETKNGWFLNLGARDNNKNQTNEDQFIATVVYSLIDATSCDIKFATVLANALGTKAKKKNRYLQDVAVNFLKKHLATSSMNKKTTAALTIYSTGKCSTALSKQTTKTTKLTITTVTEPMLSLYDKNTTVVAAQNKSKQPPSTIMTSVNSFTLPMHTDESVTTNSEKGFFKLPVKQTGAAFDWLLLLSARKKTSTNKTRTEASKSTIIFCVPHLRRFTTKNLGTLALPRNFSPHLT